MPRQHEYFITIASNNDRRVGVVVPGERGKFLQLVSHKREA